MKKNIALLVAIVIIISGSIVIADKNFSFIPEKVITHEEAVAFADGIMELDRKDYDAAYRLVVSSKREVSDENAVSIVKGVNNLYVLQYENEEQVINAQDYLSDLSYINYVEKNDADENYVCESEDNSETETSSFATTDIDIDDAIKLVQREVSVFHEVHVGFIDSGISINSVTESRFAGGYTFVDGFPEGGTYDGTGHGTMTSGMVIFNTLDNVKVHSYQIFNEKGQCYDLSKVLSAMYMAISDGCKIINCSFTGSGDSAKQEAVEYGTRQGCIFVAAAGNSGLPAASFPAWYEDSISVGAINRYMDRSPGSNYGKKIDIYAPGLNVPSLNRDGTVTGRRSGTSVSTPLISAIVALFATVNPDITAKQAEKLLQETGECLFRDDSYFVGELKADAYAALKKLTNSELEQVQLDYTVTCNPDDGSANITFNCDEDATVYYYSDYGFIIPSDGKYSDSTVTGQLKNGETITVSENKSFKAVAYAKGKEKSEYQIFSVPVLTGESGFSVTQAAETGQYSKVSYCALTDKIIEVPEVIDGVQIQEIDESCFMGNKNVEVIVLPEHIKKIDRFAFANCPNLKVVIAPGVTECAHMAFYNCRNLKSVRMPDVTVAEAGVFKNCCSLNDLQLGKLTKICNQAFYCCENLRYLEASNDITFFSDNTFFNCPLLTVHAPDGSYVSKYAIEKNIPVGDISDADICNHESEGTAIVSVAASCTGYGYEVYSYDDGCYSGKYTTAFGHTYVLKVVKPTCINYGYNEYTCSVCADTYRDSYKYFLEHDWEITVTKEPTFDEDGEKRYVCKFCGKQKTEVLPSYSSYHTVSGNTVLAQTNSGNYDDNYILPYVDVYINENYVATSDENGNFNFDVVNGTYTINFRYDCGIQSQVICTVNDGDISIGAVAVIGMDFFDDDYINAKDYALLQKQAKTGYKEEYDLNNDGCVDDIDLGMFRDFIYSIGRN